MAKDNREALRPYVADMAAVEKHILEAIERQRKDDDIQQFPDAAQWVGRVEGVLRRHVDNLDSHLKNFDGGGVAGTVKEALTGVLGTVAGLYDKVRKDTASRALRDDYTALSLAAISYTMLHTTALGLSQGTTAEPRPHGFEGSNTARDGGRGASSRRSCLKEPRLRGLRHLHPGRRAGRPQHPGGLAARKGALRRGRGLDRRLLHSLERSRNLRGRSRPARPAFLFQAVSDRPTLSAMPTRIRRSPEKGLRPCATSMLSSIRTSPRRQSNCRVFTS